MFLLLIAPSLAASWSLSDGSVSWPLCGRITEAPPSGWTERDGCPSDRVDSSADNDLPLASTFGPRLVSSDDDRYDFHRGVDLSTDCGTPVFAVASGEVSKAGADSAHADLVVQLQHGRDPSCTGGCTSSLYNHLAGVDVSAGERVAQGQLIGWTGYSGIGDDEAGSVGAKCASATGYEHLHFELRQAPASEPESAWQQDAINPLGQLPFPDIGNPTELRLEVDDRDPLAPLVTLEIEMDVDALGLQRVELDVLENTPQGLVDIPQPGDAPDSNGYPVEPPVFDPEALSGAYTHRDSVYELWESFSDCPFADDHGAEYDPSVHLDATDGEHSVGAFNGMVLAPEAFDDSSTVWRMTLEFTELIGTDRADSLCVRAMAQDLRGAWTFAEEHNCSPIDDSDPEESSEDRATVRPERPITFDGAGSYGARRPR